MDNEEIQGVKFSEFPSQTPSNSDEVVGLHSGDNVRFSIANIVAAVRQGLANIFVPLTRTINGKALNSDISLDSSDIDYDNTQSGLTATDVQEAIDELAQGGGGGSAADITYDPTTSGASAINVQDALDEAFGDLDDKQSTITASGILKGDGAGGVSAAVAGTDYASASITDSLNNRYTNSVSWIGNADFDNYVTSGMYPMSTGNSNSPANWGILFVIAPRYDQINQLYMTDGTIWYREKKSSTWSSWATLTGKANENQIAYFEPGTTASQNYSISAYIFWNGLLYNANQAISSGTTLSADTGGNLSECVGGGFNYTIVYPESVYETTDLTVKLNERRFGKVVCLYFYIYPKTTLPSSGTSGIQLNIHNPPPYDISAPTGLTLSASNRNIGSLITLSPTGAFQLLGARTAGRPTTAIVEYIVL